MQVFWTVVAGVMVFVLGQIIQNFILRPMLDFKNTVAQISHKIKFHANIITNSGLKDEFIKWSTEDMRDLSSQLEARYLSIPFLDFFSKIKILPKRENIREAAKDLILLSNAGGKKGFEIKNAKVILRIKTNLKIVL